MFAVGTGTLELVSAALTAGSSIPYLIAIRRRSVRPQRTSWLVFASLSAIAAVAQLQAGSTAGAWLAAGSALGFAAIFVCSLWRGVGGWDWADRGTLAIAVVSAGLLLLGHPLVALAAVIAAEIAAAALTVRKVVAAPYEEVCTSWTIDAVAGVLALAAVASSRSVDAVYPIHHILVNVWVAAVVLRSRTRLHRVATIGSAARP
jgi:hypothetical protein